MHVSFVVESLKSLLICAELPEGRHATKGQTLRLKHHAYGAKMSDHKCTSVPPPPLPSPPAAQDTTISFKELLPARVISQHIDRRSHRGG